MLMLLCAIVFGVCNTLPYSLPTYGGMQWDSCEDAERLLSHDRRVVDALGPEAKDFNKSVAPRPSLPFFRDCAVTLSLLRALGKVTCERKPSPEDDVLSSAVAMLQMPGHCETEDLEAGHGAGLAPKVLLASVGEVPKEHAKAKCSKGSADSGAVAAAAAGLRCVAGGSGRPVALEPCCGRAACAGRPTCSGSVTPTHDLHSYPRSLPNVQIPFLEKTGRLATVL